MLTEGTYRTEASASFELSRVYTAPVVRLWWMIVVSNDFLNFRNLEFGPFCRSTRTPPYRRPYRPLHPDRVIHRYGDNDRDCKVVPVRSITRVLVSRMFFALRMLPRFDDR
jgi:hypothetical protein